VTVGIITFKKHVGVHKAFSEHFIKTGIFDQKYYHWLVATFNSRLVGDYAIRTEFENDEVREWIDQARDFLGKVRDYLTSS
jgi:uncharacterized protein (UPF0332 family)